MLSISTLFPTRSSLHRTPIQFVGILLMMGALLFIGCSSGPSIERRPVLSPETEVDVDTLKRPAVFNAITPEPPLDQNSQPTLRAEAKAGHDLQFVSLWLDGEEVKSCDEAQCTYKVDGLQPGEHVFYAEAIDEVGERGTSTVLRFKVEGEVRLLDEELRNLEPLLSTQSLSQPPRVSALEPQVKPHQPEIKWGGRTMAVSVHPNSSSGNRALAATESGGLFRTRDGGNSWSPIEGRYPHRLSDVAHAPSDPSVIIATARGDPRRLERQSPSVSGGGIWRSTDGGQTWEKPPTAEPDGECTGIAPKGQSAAHGIAFEPGTQNVYVGTDCGLAVSTDQGATWSHIATPSQKRQGKPSRIVSVVSPAQGVVDVCANRGTLDAGHLRYNTQQDSWDSSTISNDLPNGCHGSAVHSLAVSPTDNDVLFAIVRDRDTKCGNNTKREVYESDDGGKTWTDLDAPGCTGNRIPFVATPPVAGANGDYDIYAGKGVSTHRQNACDGSRSSGQCQSGASNWPRRYNNDNGRIAHDDGTGIFYAPNSSCPAYLTDDGGVETTSDCGDTWSMAGKGSNDFDALQLYGVWGQTYSDHTDLYLGTQDNEVWASSDNGQTWPNSVCCEVGFLDMAKTVGSHSPQVVTGEATGGAGPFKSDPHLQNTQGWNRPPNTNCCVPRYVDDGVYVQESATSPETVYLSTNTGGSWSQIATVQGAKPWSLKVTGPSSNPTLYTGAGQGGIHGLELIRLNNVRGGGNANTTDVSPASSTSPGKNIAVHVRGEGTFHWKTVYGASPDGQWIIATDTEGNLVTSRNGGQSWSINDPLTDAVTSNGLFFGRYGTKTKKRQSQTTTVGFATFNYRPGLQTLPLIGTEANGIITSLDNGTTWGRIPGSRKIPAVTDFFADDRRDDIYVSSYGRGLWKIDRIDKLAPIEYKPDAMEEDDEPSEATNLNNAASLVDHTHLNYPQALQDNDWYGSDEETWTWTMGRPLNLQDDTDEDWFRLTLPDPQQAQQSHPHPVIPECTSIQRNQGIGANQIRGAVRVESELEVFPNPLRNLPTGVPKPDDVAKIYDVTGGRMQELNSTKCLYERGVREVLISYGERSQRRGVFHEYNPKVQYEISVDWVGYSQDLEDLEDRIAGGDRLDLIECGDGQRGRFPDCDPEINFGIGSGKPGTGCKPPGPCPLGGQPECEEPLPCPEFHAFRWDQEADLNLRFASDQPMNVEVLDSKGEPVGRAVEVSGHSEQGFRSEEGREREAGRLEPEQPLNELKETFNRQKHGRHRPELGNSGSTTVVKRLVIPSFEPGTYVLKIEGKASTVKMNWEPPSQSPNQRGFEDQDGYENPE